MRFVRHRNQSPAVQPNRAWQSLTIEQAIRRVISQRSINLQPRTIINWRSIGKKFQRILPVPIGKLKADDLRDYQKRRLTEGIARSSIRQEMTVALVALQAAGRGDLRVPLVQRDKQQERTGVALTNEQQTKLLIAAKSHRILYRCVLLGLSGLRYHEILNLRRSDVDDDGFLTIRRSKTRAGQRKIPLPPAVLLELRNALAEIPPAPESFLFQHRDDPTKHRHQIDSAWTKARRACGLTHVRFHDLRHTCITMMCEAGIPDWTIRAYVGHIDEKAMQTYSHPRMKALTEASKSLLITSPHTPETPGYPNITGAPPRDHRATQGPSPQPKLCEHGFPQGRCVECAWH